MIKWYEKIKDWSSLDARQRLNIMLAVCLVVESYIIIHLYVIQIPQINENNRTTIQRIVDRYTFRETSVQTKLDLCNQAFLQYLKESEAKYRSLLFETRELRTKVNNKDEDILD